MELKIKKVNNKIIASFAREELEISETSDNWTTEGINKFLIKLASSSSDKIQLIFETEPNDQDEILKHVYNLFETFVSEFNKKIDEENI